MKIAILIGHGESEGGSYDPGAVNGSYHEFRIAREIGKAAWERLRQLGADCQLVNYDGTFSLSDRIRQFRGKEADFLAEVHLNSGSSTASGPEVYYFPGDGTGQKYAAAISAAVSAALGLPDRGAKASDYYGIIRETGPTACLVETCFISSPDLDKVKTAAGQIVAGTAIADGIAKAAGLQSSANGWVKVSSDWYWFESGAAVKNRWVLDGGWWYRLGDDGKMLTGLQEVDGKGYLLNPSRGTVGGIYIPEGAKLITNEKGEIMHE